MANFKISTTYLYLLATLAGIIGSFSFGQNPPHHPQKTQHLPHLFLSASLGSNNVAKNTQFSLIGPSIHRPYPLFFDTYSREIELSIGQYKGNVIADPMVFKDDRRIILSGTGGGDVHDTSLLKFYTSSDGLNFSYFTTYDTRAFAASESKYDYCHLWGPEISKVADRYALFFSAQRLPKGALCPDRAGIVTTYIAWADDKNLNFGPPELIRIGPSASNPNANAFQGHIMLDGNLYTHGDQQRFFYTFHDNGNKIASTNTTPPYDLQIVTVPQEGDQNVTEGPSIFERNGIFYMLYSHGEFFSNYQLSYLMGDSLDNLKQNRHIFPLYHSTFSPTRTCPKNIFKKLLLSAGGHNSIVDINGDYFLYYHKLKFNSTCDFLGRSTFRQQLSFNPDGTLKNLTELKINWNREKNFKYSIDIKLKGEAHYMAPCIENSLLTGNSYTFTGLCPSANERAFSKSLIESVGLCASFRGRFHRPDETYCFDQKFDGREDQINFSIDHQLVRFGTLSNTPPIGELDFFDLQNNRLFGWAIDPDAFESGRDLIVHLYKQGPYDDNQIFLGASMASQERFNVTHRQYQQGSSFSFKVEEEDRVPGTKFFAYALNDPDNGHNPLIGGLTYPKHYHGFVNPLFESSYLWGHACVKRQDAPIAITVTITDGQTGNDIYLGQVLAAEESVDEEIRFLCQTEHSNFVFVYEIPQYIKELFPQLNFTATFENSAIPVPKAN